MPLFVKYLHIKYDIKLWIQNNDVFNENTCFIFTYSYKNFAKETYFLVLIKIL